MKRLLVALFIGLLLLVPIQLVQADAPAAASETGLGHAVKLGTYYVRPGDSLWPIAQRFRTTVGSIQEINHLSGTMIYAGQPLTVPTQVTLWREGGAQPPTPPSSSYSQEVLRLTNVERAQAGLAALVGDDALARVAQEKARDMQVNGYFSHISPTYGSPFDMMRQFGVSFIYAAENIAKGYQTPVQVVAGWMSSSGHRANILNPNLTNLGVGVAGDVWVQMFRRP